MQWLIGIDGGGTKTVGCAADVTGRILGRVETGPGNYHTAGLENFRKNIADIVEKLAVHCCLRTDDLQVISLGLAGADRSGDEKTLVGELAKLGLSCHYLVNSDAKAALVAGLGKEEGIVLIAGTGSIAYGINSQGHVIRAGGWGHLASDEGSGYAIGRQALVRTIKAEEQRDLATVLLPMIMKQLAVHTWDELIGFINRPLLTKAEVAALASVVAAAAQAGDATAVEILNQAGAELARLVQSVIHRGFGTSGFAQVCVYGSVVKKIPLVRRRLAAALTGQAVMVSSEKEPVEGAVSIGIEWLRKSR